MTSPVRTEWVLGPFVLLLLFVLISRCDHAEPRETLQEHPESTHLSQPTSLNAASAYWDPTVRPALPAPPNRPSAVLRAIGRQHVIDIDLAPSSRAQGSAFPTSIPSAPVDSLEDTSPT